ncbi:MAG: hypothetical protein WCI26_08775 [Acidimicrobiales bacterium]
MRVVAGAVTFQVSDLAKNYRNVLDQARRSRAMVRDKDGKTLVMMPVGDLWRDSQMAEFVRDLLRLERAVSRGDNDDVIASGSLSWVSVLPLESQQRFVEELYGPVQVALSGGPISPVHDLIADWMATADTWADVDLRQELLGYATEPLVDFSL